MIKYNAEISGERSESAALIGYSCKQGRKDC